MDRTKHCERDRKKRLQFISNTIGMGEDLDTFEEITHNTQKPCLHIITTTGVYKIVSLPEHKLITAWIARPQQLKDLYKKHHKELPKWLLVKAVEHKQDYLTYVGESSKHYHGSTTKGFESNLKPVRGKKNKKIVY